MSRRGSKQRRPCALRSRKIYFVNSVIVTDGVPASLLMSEAARNFAHKFIRPAEEPGSVAFFTIDRRTLSGLATMPPVVADGHHGTQTESGHCSNGIEPALAFDANRLKGE